MVSSRWRAYLHPVWRCHDFSSLSPKVIANGFDWLYVLHRKHSCTRRWRHSLVPRYRCRNPVNAECVDAGDSVARPDSQRGESSLGVIGGIKLSPLRLDIESRTPKPGEEIFPCGKAPYRNAVIHGVRRMGRGNRSAFGSKVLCHGTGPEAAFHFLENEIGLAPN